MNRKAKLSLVGCGPGALDLITLRGVEAIKQADVLLYDALIHPDLLHHNHGAIKCYVGKRGGKRVHKTTSWDTLTDIPLKAYTFAD
jgi:uroporphyrin-III C-methyltransferase